MRMTKLVPVAISLAFISLQPAAVAQSTLEPTANGKSLRAMTTTKCNGLTKTKIRASDGPPGSGFDTTSAVYVDVAAATMTIKVGGTGPSCVVVTLSAMSAAIGSGATAYVRAIMNGSIAALPPEVIFKQNTPPGFVEAGTYQFLFRNITPGTKTIKIQLKAGSPGTVYMHDPIVRVDYR